MTDFARLKCGFYVGSHWGRDSGLVLIWPTGQDVRYPGVACRPISLGGITRCTLGTSLTRLAK